MNITSIAFSVLLVGVPVFTGIFFLVAYFGSNRAASGASMLIFGAAVSFVFMRYMPEGRMTGGDFFFTVPWVLVVALASGAIAGLVKRRQK